MHIVKPARPRDAARKYDIITALGAYALARDKHDQRLVLRLITLITARYNWARDELAVGQREIARLWSVDERTVKREMAKLRGKGWLVVKRQGARGRVTEYGMDLDRMLAMTEGDWSNVGPDFDLRMSGKTEETPVVSLPLKGDVPPPMSARARNGFWPRRSCTPRHRTSMAAGCAILSVWAGQGAADAESAQPVSRNLCSDASGPPGAGRLPGGGFGCDGCGDRGLIRCRFT